ncbi:uncharacterized protein BDR25DRAFT_392697 [Lindgomyces ingoldianus]|uniref:Uncharacterized protein n=1 Tax=Lindgomyces ingoldianus TaxID=673940 RepID=A0ACB6R115_9PLEO|nr:uncharacterized protein BDR25DRAFT_392697 [Lindgomyces ingoldianus]KAF2472841.1 hypothetical protein BDR25DRAFT_392697 [Lindgomyces ingoldianus]
MSGVCRLSFILEHGKGAHIFDAFTFIILLLSVPHITGFYPHMPRIFTKEITDRERKISRDAKCLTAISLLLSTLTSVTALQWPLTLSCQVFFHSLGTLPSLFHPPPGPFYILAAVYSLCSTYASFRVQQSASIGAKSESKRIISVERVAKMRAMELQSISYSLYFSIRSWMQLGDRGLCAILMFTLDTLFDLQSAMAVLFPLFWSYEKFLGGLLPFLTWQEFDKLDVGIIPSKADRIPLHPEIICGYASPECLTPEGPGVLPLYISVMHEEGRSRSNTEWLVNLVVVKMFEDPGVSERRFDILMQWLEYKEGREFEMTYKIPSNDGSFGSMYLLTSMSLVNHLAFLALHYLISIANIGDWRMLVQKGRHWRRAGFERFCGVGWSRTRMIEISVWVLMHEEKMPMLRKLIQVINMTIPAIAGPIFRKHCGTAEQIPRVHALPRISRMNKKYKNPNWWMLGPSKRRMKAMHYSYWRRGCRDMKTRFLSWRLHGRVKRESRTLRSSNLEPTSSSFQVTCQRTNKPSASLGFAQSSILFRQPE